MNAKPNPWMRGYTNEWANTQPAVTVLDTHRVIHLERDYWVSAAELSDLAAEDAMAYQVAQAMLFWVAISVIGAAFGLMTWLGVLPA